MGQITSHEALLPCWAELCADPRWHDLGGKLELNGMGVIEMWIVDEAGARQVHDRSGPRANRLLNPTG